MHRRRRENSGANVAAYCLLFLLFIILIISIARNGNNGDEGGETQNGSKTMYGGCFLVLLVILLFSMTTVYYEYDPEGDDSSDDNILIVYGASWCGWTTKQRSFLDQNNIEYEYIECGNNNDSRCSVAQGFPTLQYGSTIRSGAILSIDKLNSELGCSI